MSSQVREYRSPHRLWGWVAVAFAVVGTAVFFVGVEWSEFKGTLSDYTNLAKVPISALILAGLGLHVALCIVRTTANDIVVRKLFRSVRWQWADVLRITEDDVGVVRAESRAKDRLRICALSRIVPFGERRPWQTSAIDDLRVALGSPRERR